MIITDLDKVTTLSSLHFNLEVTGEELLVLFASVGAVSWSQINDTFATMGFSYRLPEIRSDRIGKNEQVYQELKHKALQFKSLK